MVLALEEVERVEELAEIEREELEEELEAIEREEEEEEEAGVADVELGVVGAPAHTSCVEPISTALLVAKPLNRTALIAFKFAPENELSGTVIV